MTLPALFVSSFLMAFSGAMMPGPLLTVNIHESYRLGFRAGPLLIFGHGILETLLVIGLTLGLDAYLVQPFFKGSVALVGGIVLLWMGWGIARDSLRGKVTLNMAAGGKVKRMHPVLAGIVVSISNPYWSLWWATIGLTYLALAVQQGVIALAVFLGGHLLADLIWYSAISLAVVSGRKFISDQVYQGILVICGVFLVVLALYFIWSGKTFLFGS